MYLGYYCFIITLDKKVRFKTHFEPGYSDWIRLSGKTGSGSDQNNTRIRNTALANKSRVVGTQRGNFVKTFQLFILLLYRYAMVYDMESILGGNS